MSLPTIFRPLKILGDQLFFPVFPLLRRYCRLFASLQAIMHQIWFVWGFAQDPAGRDLQRFPEPVMDFRV